MYFMKVIKRLLDMPHTILLMHIANINITLHISFSFVAIIMLYIIIHLILSVKRLIGLHVQLHLKFTR